jgi:NADH:ubiquinone oxidoreductase subunit B-like Fe-S oxidoreductase
MEPRAIVLLEGLGQLKNPIKNEKNNQREIEKENDDQEKTTRGIYKGKMKDRQAYTE